MWTIYSNGDGNLIANATIVNQYNTDSSINIKFDIINPQGVIVKTLTQNNTPIKANSNVVVTPSYSGTS